MKTLAALVLALLIAVPAMAEDSPAVPPMKEPHKNYREMKFEERKAEALKRLNERIAELQKKQACVEAATSHDTIEACFPKRMKRHPGGGDDSGRD